MGILEVPTKSLIDAAGGYWQIRFNSMNQTSTGIPVLINQSHMTRRTLRKRIFSHLKISDTVLYFNFDSSFFFLEKKTNQKQTKQNKTKQNNKTNHPDTYSVGAKYIQQNAKCHEVMIDNDSF